MKRKNFALRFTASIVLLALIFVALLASGALTPSTNVSASRITTRANIRIYSDRACTQQLTSINWGTISSGSSVTRTIYIKNLGYSSLKLSLTTTDWIPANANGPVTLTWNKQGTWLGARQVVTATLTLRVSSSISGISTFSMNALVSAIG